MSANLKEIYSSANGDVWFLERAPDGLFVIHEPNKSSGGNRSRIPAQEFARRGGWGPEVIAVREEIAQHRESRFDDESA
jgi:hypothetical protein